MKCIDLSRGAHVGLLEVTEPFNVSILFNDYRKGCRIEYLNCHGL
jgi:hypothetical protein